mgnify:CR=1 FL=1
MADDPFPHEAFGALIRRVPSYGRLAWRLGRDPLLSRARRAALSSTRAMSRDPGAPCLPARAQDPRTTSATRKAQAAQTSGIKVRRNEHAAMAPSPRDCRAPDCR